MRQPLFRRSYEAAALLEQHPPQFNHPYKAALFEMACPPVSVPQGTIEVTRWPAGIVESVLLPDTAAEVRSGYFDYRPTGEGTASLEWHVNFADPRLFAAYGSALFAQDEMQVAEHPLLACVREALLAEGLAAKTRDETSPTPVLVRNVERRIEVSTAPAAGRPQGLYGNRFAEAPLDTIRRATRRIEPPTYSNIIAMAAPSGGRGDYTERQIEYIFRAAHTAFTAARHESAPTGGPVQTIIHTGFWGCGAFGGNRKLMIALQALAARAAQIDRLVFHAGEELAIPDAERGLQIASSLAARCGSPCTVDKLVGRAAILGFQWGVSDGN